MRSYCTNYNATMPELTVYMNCDTRLAINISRFHLGENDEFIFVIKNYSYADSSYVFLYRAKTSEIDANGEILFKIPPATSRLIKPGAFYNFAVMRNAFDSSAPTEYKKLTDNGDIIIEYGAHDFTIKKDDTDLESEVISMRLELINNDEASINANAFMGEIAGIRLELVEE